MKNRIRLTESKLKDIVRESVKRVINEGSINQNTLNMWYDVREKLGDETFINELWNWMSSDDIEGVIEHIDRNYELGLFDEEEEPEEEDFEEEEIEEI